MASFNLSNLADRLSQVISQNTSISSVFGKNDRAVRELFSSLSNGETILAKVLSVSEDSFQISTGDNIILNAKADNGVTLSVGSNVLFEVNKFGDDKVSLRPLYLNTNYEETAKTALNQAGISENPRSLELVARSMEYGNPIDRDSLLLAYRDVLEFPEVPVKYLVDLRKMGLEVNQANIEGFENFMNMKNVITDAFDHIAEGLADEVSISFYAHENIENTDSVLSNGLTMKGFEQSLKTIDGMIKFVDSMEGRSVALLDFFKDDIQLLINKLSDNNVDTKNLNNLFEIDSSVSAKEVLKAVLSDVRSTVISPFESDDEGIEEIKVPKFESVFKDETVKNVFSRALISSWTLEENNIEKKEIKELVNRLYNESHNLIDALNNSSVKNSSVSEMVNNLNRNLEFMEQLNHYMPYIQIPFNSDNGTHSGELYIYKNKKRLTEGDSELTAYLHLDMDNLGPTDVYVSLKYNNVSTNFKMANEEALNLINDNISFLDKRLSDKGYSLKCEFSVIEKQKSPLQEMLFANENHLIVSKNSFDARV